MIDESNTLMHSAKLADRIPNGWASTLPRCALPLHSWPTKKRTTTRIALANQADLAFHPSIRIRSTVLPVLLYSTYAFWVQIALYTLVSWRRVPAMR
jgi:hypothetical protein